MTDISHAGTAGRGIDRSRAIYWGVAALTTILVFGPITPIIFQAFLDKPLYDDTAVLTLGNFSRLFSEPGMAGVFFNTLYFGALTMLVAQVFGAIMAVLGSA